MALSNNKDFFARVAAHAEAKAEEREKEFHGYAHLDEHLPPSQIREISAALTVIHPDLSLTRFEEAFRTTQQEFRFGDDKGRILPALVRHIGTLSNLIQNGTIDPFTTLSTADLFGKDLLLHETSAIANRRRIDIEGQLSKDVSDLAYPDFRNLAVSLGPNDSDNQALLLAATALTVAARELGHSPQVRNNTTLKQKPDVLSNVSGIQDAHLAMARLMTLLGADLSKAGQIAALVNGISDGLEGKPKPATAPRGPAMS